MRRHIKEAARRGLGAAAITTFGLVAAPVLSITVPVAILGVCGVISVRIIAKGDGGMRDHLSPQHLAKSRGILERR